MNFDNDYATSFKRYFESWEGIMHIFTLFHYSFGPFAKTVTRAAVRVPAGRPRCLYLPAKEHGKGRDGEDWLSRRRRWRRPRIGHRQTTGSSLYSFESCLSLQNLSDLKFLVDFTDKTSFMILPDLLLFFFFLFFVYILGVSNALVCICSCPNFFSWCPFFILNSSLADGFVITRVVWHLEAQLYLKVFGSMACPFREEWVKCLEFRLFSVAFFLLFVPCQINRCQLFCFFIQWR